MNYLLPVILLVASVLSSYGQTPIRELVIQLKTPSGMKVGHATFRPTIDGRLNISLELKYLRAGEHAVHIHENPVCDEGRDFKTAGGHFNPEGKQHGIHNPRGHHAGDLPENINFSLRAVRETNWITVGVANFTVADLSLVPNAHNSILGRSIIVHDKPDDMKTDPTGNSGNRVACGVIEAPRSR